MRVDPGQAAIELLLAMRSDDGTEAARAARSLERMSEEDLRAGLPDDDARLAFWVDVYNAAVLQQPLDQVSTLRGRLRFFRRSVVTVAARPLSLDVIEHGILRRSRWKLGLGYLSNPLPPPFERRHRVASVDARVHFALNCGAASCPPIAAYERARMDDQLDLATRRFLAANVTREGRTLRLPAVMLWFIGDFGGPRGIRRFLAGHDIDCHRQRLRFQRYDWSPAPDNWAAED